MKTSLSQPKGRCGLALLCWCTFVSPLLADPLDQWALRNPLPTAEPLVGIAYGSGQFVAVGGAMGGAGAIVTSPDGIDWTNRTWGTTNRHFFAGIAYGNNLFVAVGDAGAHPGIIVTSPDGIQWTERTSGTDYHLSAIACGNSTFVAVGFEAMGYDAGQFAVTVTSPDGITWTPHQSEQSFVGITFGNNQFVRVNLSGQIESSPDGLTWTRRFDASGGSGPPEITFAGIAYGNHQFVAIGTGNFNATNQYGAIVTSPDGVTWTRRNSDTTSELKGICYGNNEFIAVSTGFCQGAWLSGGGDGTTILTSPDGITWTRRASGTNNPLRAIAYGDSHFVAVGDPGSIVTSSDGITWTNRGSGAVGLVGGSLSGITFANNQFVGVGYSGWYESTQSPGAVTISPDGLTWSRGPSGTTVALSAVAYGNKLYVAVGKGWDPTTGTDYGAIFTSPDGLNWTSRVSGVTNGLSGVAFGDNRFVAVGDWVGPYGFGSTRVIVTSPDGITWTNQNFGTDESLSGIAFGNNLFIAVGTGWDPTKRSCFGAIFTSPDGLTWTSRASGVGVTNSPWGGPSMILSGIEFGNNQFVAVGPDSILTSRDGLTWTSQATGRGGFAVAYGNNQFVVVGEAILTSPDGITWTDRILSAGVALYGVAYGNNKFVAVGVNDLVLQSGVLAPPVITAPPTSLAVSLGSNATFSVTATGTAPLTYQWRSETGDLAGATDTSLVISNVSLADLGSYTLTVRNAYGEITSEPAWLKLARWMEMVVFGDSYSLAQFSNGKAWVDWLGESLCLSALGQMKNYGAGGAGTLAVRSQINQYLSANVPGTNTLLATTWAGVSWDLGVNHYPVSQVVSNYATNLTLLAQAGGRAFILPTIPPLYLLPLWSGDSYLRALDYPDLNARLDREIQKLTTNFTGLTVFRPDWSNQVVRVLANPAACGFTNATDAANACAQCDPNLYVFWDGAHPTTAGHRWFAQEAYRQLTPPLVMALPAPLASGRLGLEWKGGSPPFRVQHTGDLVSGLWQSEAPTFGTNAMTMLSAPQEFFRILFLGQ